MEKKTKIMYNASLSYQMLKFYLWHIVELGLLEESEGEEFRITEKGREFLSRYHNMTGLLAGPDGASSSRSCPFARQRKGQIVWTLLLRCECLNHCMIPYVALEAKPTIRLAMLRSIIIPDGSI